MKTSNKKRRNHLLPICYQKGFANPDGQVWVQFLTRDKPPLYLNPISVGVMHKFYTRYKNGFEDDSIETFFQKNVEDLYAPLARRVKEEKSDFVITKEDVLVLLRFVASQIVRTQAHMRCIEEQAGRVLNVEDFIHNMGRKMGKMVDAWKAKPPDISLYTSLPNIGTHFITGDNPVIAITQRVNHTGIETPFDSLSTVDIDKILEDPISEFTVPLSPYVCLTVRNGGSGMMNPFPQSREPAWTRMINRRIYGQCVQFVEAMDKDTLAFHEKRPGALTL